MGNDLIEAVKALQEIENKLMRHGEPWHYSEAMMIAIREVKKGIPIPPITEAWSPNRCPTCCGDLGGDCDDGYYENGCMDVCPYCRQRLDYSNSGWCEPLTDVYMRGV